MQKGFPLRWTGHRPGINPGDPTQFVVSVQFFACDESGSNKRQNGARSFPHEQRARMACPKRGQAISTDVSNR